MGAFTVPAPGEPFAFTIGEGKGARTYEVPHLADLPTEEFNDVMDRLDEVRGDNRASVMVARDVFETHAPGSTGGMTFAQLAATSDAWVTDGGEEAGEGGSSSD